MKHLKITQVRPQGEYILCDEETNITYSFILEFFNVDKPQSGDILILHEDLIDYKNEHYSHAYSFDVFDKKRDDVKTLHKNELAGLHTKNSDFILKRIYG